MSRQRCPGQDMRYWRPEDISFLRCPSCGAEVELWKDEPARACPGCGKEIRNAKLDPNCARWCSHAQDCPGARPPGSKSP